MEKVKYQEAINYLVERVGVSEHQVRQVLKHIGFLIKDAVYEGYDIDLTPLFKIRYQVKGQLIYNNPTYTLDNIVEDCSKVLSNYDKDRVALIIELYIAYLLDSLERGVNVSIKGVATLLVEESDGQVMVSGRMSPQLQKAEVADFMIMAKGEIEIRSISNRDLRLSFSLSDELKMPRRVRKRNKISFASEL